MKTGWGRLAVASVTILGAVSAQVPRYVNYQGRLTDGSGSGLLGTQRIEVSVYDAAQGGTEIWGPQTFPAVPMVDGAFNLVLGEMDEHVDGTGKAAPRSIGMAFRAPERYVSIRVGGGEISPRQRVLVAPTAFRSMTDVPVGGILPWLPPVASFSGLSLGQAKALCPQGFRLCVGPEANEVDDPATAFDETRIPNLLAGQFLKGWGSTEAVTLRGGGAEAHRHSSSGRTEGASAYESRSERDGWSGEVTSGHQHDYSGDTDNVSSLPPFFSVLFIIRVD